MPKHKQIVYNKTVIPEDKFGVHEVQIIHVVEYTDFYLLLEKTGKPFYRYIFVLKLTGTIIKYCKYFILKSVLLLNSRQM